jgi:hypothetical protein
MERGQSGLAARLAAAQAELADPVRDGQNPHYASRYATLGAVLAAVRPVLARHGLAVVQDVRTETSGDRLIVSVTTRLLADGEALDCGPASVSLPATAGPQAVGSAITYLRRYCLQAAVGVASADDDDAEAAEAARAEPRPQARSRTSRGRQGTTTASPAASPVVQTAQELLRLIGEARTLDELNEVGERIRARAEGLPEGLVRMLRRTYTAQMRRIEQAQEPEGGKQ